LTAVFQLNEKSKQIIIWEVTWKIDGEGLFSSIPYGINFLSLLAATYSNATYSNQNQIKILVSLGNMTEKSFSHYLGFVLPTRAT
jgi:hypothetical protein